MNKLFSCLFLFTVWGLVFGVLFGLLYAMTPPEMLHNCESWASLGLVAGAFLGISIEIVTRS